MQPHEKRLVDEKVDLDAKLHKLREFTGSEMFQSLDDLDRALLETQRDQMTCYSNTLGRRIKRFG